VIDGRPPRTPAWMSLAAGITLGAGTMLYFIAFHEMSRGLVGGFGSPLPTVALAVAGSCIGALPLLALLPIALLPAWWCGRGLPERRRRCGACPDCGYPGSRFPCPECGGDGAVAPLELFSRTALVRALALASMLFAGSVIWAEVRVRGDETRFRQEVDALLARDIRENLARPRAGWGSFAILRYDPATGFSAPPPFDHERIPGWRAVGRVVPQGR
jgi:hypothetical protein